MVRLPQCCATLSFANKRPYFRLRLESLSPERRPSVPIRVSRNRVFEGSFEQLIHLPPESMRGRLSVSFEGEEGVDVGGVTREWYRCGRARASGFLFATVYHSRLLSALCTRRLPPPLTCTHNSVLAKEMFKPDYALFTPSVDSPTYQPNPLSYIVDNHLKFFKFVGRVIGVCGTMVICWLLICGCSRPLTTSDEVWGLLLGL
jgi:E3 ubiquitin-protein ligase HUWE1